MKCTVRVVWHSDGAGYAVSCEARDEDGLLALWVTPQAPLSDLISAAKEQWAISLGEQLTLPFD